MNEDIPSPVTQPSGHPPFVWHPRPEGENALVWRYPANPILGRRQIPCAQAVYNSAVVEFGDRYAGIFRADHMDGLPDLHAGWSSDGIRWEIEGEPLAFDFAGCEERKASYGYDPRVTRIGDDFFIAWCSEYHGPTIGLARTADFRSFERMENAFLPNNRNGVLFPRKIGGRYAMLSRPSDGGHTPFGEIFYSESPDLRFWGNHRFVMRPGDLWWESVKIGSGAVPIETAEGWLLFYHGVRSTCNGMVYSMGAALLDLDRPWRVIARIRGPILMPEREYEITGFVPNVVFPCAALHDEPTGRLAIYYGAADTHVALAFAFRDELLGELSKNRL